MPFAQVCSLQLFLNNGWRLSFTGQAPPKTMTGSKTPTGTAAPTSRLQRHSLADRLDCGHHLSVACLDSHSLWRWLHNRSEYVGGTTRLRGRPDCSQRPTGPAATTPAGHRQHQKESRAPSLWMANSPSFGTRWCPSRPKWLRPPL